ncbi:MAG: Ig-like domain-containing protein [Labilithrix sp.]|nr:Ig-like domain-containing protein [Labilithrix sp.]
MKRPSVAVALALTSLAACKPAPLPAPVTVFVRVLDESRQPVQNAEIASQSEIISRTDGDGRAEITVSGREGATYFVDVRCPEGYRSPEAPLEIRRLDNGPAEAPEYVTRCSRLRHKLVVHVKAVGAGGSLPVLYLGKELTRTDADGKARVVLEGDDLERIDLKLDTSDPAFAKLHPQSPTGSFEIPPLDGETTFEVKFTQDKKPPKKVVKRSGPIMM